ncbi:hypothetical protein HCN44_009494 [Aphidius gifuensis]|uniref:Phosphodiesterase n=1 Tax=Aphidius gifuensis TaxID=684658 RepID=A0A834Y3W4_APHGI|nr:cGMP-dependent 3',5'-cyclic phosphodiesterase-like [Aphidius gifuensis]KAF7998096.1 hypothetical protein HCN44_009494 [Aphidius gifuensis]
MEHEEKDKILLLIENLADLPCTLVQQNLNKYIQNETGAKLSFLAPILQETEEIVVHVVGDEILDRGLRFSISDDILNETLKTRKSLDPEPSKLDYELLQKLSSIINPSPDQFFSVAIRHPLKKNVALIVGIVNIQTDIDFKDNCLKIIKQCFKYCLGLFLSSLKYEEEKRLKEQCQDLLRISRKLFLHLGDLPDLLKEIMIEARRLTNAERCSLFLLDTENNELVAKVFDGQSLMTDEMRLSVDQGVAGKVAKSGNLLNIRDAYNHPLFYSGFDEATGFKTKNILCFPIRDEKGIVGVAQLCNKVNGLYFDICDEEVAMAFSIYCGISIMHSIVYKKIQDSQARSKLSNELMMYHMQVEEDSVMNVVNCHADHVLEDFDKFSFNPKTIPEQHTPCFVLKMFDDLDLIKHWRIKRKTMIKFILYVKKGYRDAPYHNWLHAFSVTHFAYLMMKNLKLINEKYMTELEALVFLVSCLCHDIDHRGTNNSFQTQSGTVLASLYSSEGSVMERHHLAQSMCILNTEDCNIFESLTSDDYSEALDLLRNNILSTDLASHFRTVEIQDKIIKNGYDKNDLKQKKSINAMFMTCCDISDQTKDWLTSKKTAERIYDEFFSQGDLEKSMGTSPIEMMDREKASIPKLQEQFISNLVLPLFKNLAKLFPKAKIIVDTIIKNRDIWLAAIPIFNDYGKKGIKNMDILIDTNIEKEILQAYEKHTNSIE